jgi:hypothetical protein
MPRQCKGPDNCFRLSHREQGVEAAAVALAAFYQRVSDDQSNCGSRGIHRHVFHHSASRAPHHRRGVDNGPLTIPVQDYLEQDTRVGLIMKSIAQEVIGFGMAFALSLAASVVTVEFIRQLMSIPQ